MRSRVGVQVCGCGEHLGGYVCVACMSVLGSESMCTLECGAHVCIFESAKICALVCTYMVVGGCQLVSCVCVCDQGIRAISGSIRMQL